MTVCTRRRGAAGSSRPRHSTCVAVLAAPVLLVACSPATTHCTGLIASQPEMRSGPPGAQRITELRYEGQLGVDTTAPPTVIGFWRTNASPQDVVAWYEAMLRSRVWRRSAVPGATETTGSASTSTPASRTLDIWRRGCARPGCTSGHASASPVEEITLAISHELPNSVLGKAAGAADQWTDVPYEVVRVQLTFDPPEQVRGCD